MHLKSFGAQASGLRLERMKASPRYVDGAFVNTDAGRSGPEEGHGAPTIAEFLCGGQRRTPRAPLPSRSPLAGWQRAAGDRAARDLARPLDGAARDRRRARAHRSGLG